MLRRVSALGVALIAAACRGSVGSPPPGPSVPPSNSIAHIVILVQENRSFDNLFAGFPGADTRMRGRCAPAFWCTGNREVPLRSVKLESGGVPDFGTDIDHSHYSFETECNAGAAGVCTMDGFDLIRYGALGQGFPAELYPYAFVDRSESAPYWRLARRYALADQMFFTETAASFIAHQMLISGTVRLNDRESLTDQPTATPWGCDAPKGTRSAVIFTTGKVEEEGGPFPCFTQYATIADLLDAKNVSWRYYVDGVNPHKPHFDFSGIAWNGFDAIRKIRYGSDWTANISTPNTNIFTDLKTGRLPALSYVIPTLFDSDHPVSGCNGGPWWVTKVVNAIGTSRYWKRTVIVLIWDDWGGWYDNAPPDRIDYTSLGFRVPMIVISPYAKPHSISHTRYDFGSILKFVEATFGLGSLGTTDATANSMQDVFDFSQQPSAFRAAPLPPVLPCGKQQPDPSSVRAMIEHDGGIPE